MKAEIAKKLVEPFDRRKLKTTNGLTYIPIAEVVARMNEAVGVGRWRVEIMNTQSWGERQTLAGIAPTHIIATVRVHVFDDEAGEWTWCEGMGGQDVGFFNTPREKWWKAKKYNKQQGPEPSGPDADACPGPLNLGDNYEGACSDATKKALQHLGVGLELARDGVGVEVVEPTIDVRPEIDEEDAGAPRFSETEKKALKEAWKERFKFPARAVPDSEIDFVRSFLTSFEGTDVLPTPDPEPEERSEGGEGLKEMPEYNGTVTAEQAKQDMGAVLQSVMPEQKARREAAQLWSKARYEGQPEIGAVEWAVLTQLVNERLEIAKKS